MTIICYSMYVRMLILLWNDVWEHHRSMLVFAVSRVCTTVAPTLKLNNENDMCWGPCPLTFLKCGLMTSLCGEAVLVGRGGVSVVGLWFKHAHLENFHTLIYKHTLPCRGRAGRSTSSCSCRAGWRSGRTRSGRWWAGLPSKARGCWTGWCQSTSPSCGWGREDRSPLFPQQRSCWRGGRPPGEGI